MLTTRGFAILLGLRREKPRVISRLVIRQLMNCSYQKNQIASPLLGSMITLLGYQILSKIYESFNSEVYRAIRSSDERSVILKVLKQDYPTAQELTRYKQEYKTISSLKFDGAIAAYGLEPYGRTLVIILEDFGARSLKKWIEEKPLTLQEFLSIGIQIADNLAKIHAARIIHKDINPANIVFNPTIGKLKIIDFGIATILEQEKPSLKNPNILEGTLAYISPEQTGRMNRSLDYRTDFYSLGVTFYELLTGQLPFETTDALELVHCHLAKQPLSINTHGSLIFGEVRKIRLIRDWLSRTSSPQGGLTISGASWV